MTSKFSNRGSGQKAGQKPSMGLIPVNGHSAKGAGGRRTIAVVFDTHSDSFRVAVRSNNASVSVRASLVWEASSALSLYIREAGEIRLLTRREEAQLARRMRRGDAAARERMIRANLRFVIKVAREYEHLGLPLLDLINEGNIGLMLAVDRFDPRKGARLTTYSAWWIRQSIRRALASQANAIRLPVYAVDQAYHLHRAELRLREQLGRDATDNELAEELGLSCDRIGLLRVARLHPTSLDAPLGDGDSSPLHEVIADDSAEWPNVSLARESTLELLRELLPKLPAREAGILRLRFGLEDGVERTLEQIGSIMGLTRERVRQLQNLALAQLRRMMDDRDYISVTA